MAKKEEKKKADSKKNAAKPAKAAKATKAAKPVKAAKVENKAEKKSEPKPSAKKTPPPKAAAKPAVPKPPKRPAGPESILLAVGTRFTRTPFIFDAIEKDDKESRRKHGAIQKPAEKPTACSRPRIGEIGEGMDLVAVLSQQLEDENRNFFNGCDGKLCDRCNNNEVDPKFYVNESLGYCLECATILGLGQSKEGVFSEAQMELMKRTMESSNGDIDEDNIESVLENMELDEEALLGESDDA